MSDAIKEYCFETQVLEVQKAEDKVVKREREYNTNVGRIAGATAALGEVCKLWFVRPAVLKVLREVSEKEYAKMYDSRRLVETCKNDLLDESANSLQVKADQRSL